jgi:hypothetical protein
MYLNVTIEGITFEAPTTLQEGTRNTANEKALILEE